MKKWAEIGLFCLMMAGFTFADSSSRLNIRSEDGTTNTYPYQARFTNGTLTDNNDGTVSISITGSGGGGSSSSLEVFSGVTRSSPTASINPEPNVFTSYIHGTTFYFTLNPATTNFIQNTNLLQGATFYVSSGSVNGTLTAKFLQVSDSGSGELFQFAPRSSIFAPSANITYNLKSNGQHLNVNLGTSSSGIGTLAMYDDAANTGCGFGGFTFLSPISGGSAANSVCISGGNITGSDYTSTFGVKASTLSLTSFNVTSTSATVTGSGGLTSVYGAFVGSMTVSNLTSGQCVQAGTGGLLTVTGSACGGSGATPGLPFNSIQYNNVGAFGGSSNFEWSGTSVTIVSSVAISNVYGQGNTTLGLLDVFSNNAGALGGQPLVTIGSNQQANQISINDQQPLGLTRYGASIGGLRVGLVGTNEQIYSDQSTTQLINFWNSGVMEIRTASSGNSGKDIVFFPQQVEELRLSNTSGLIVSSSSTFNGAVGVINTGATGTLLTLSTASVGTPLVSVSTVPAVLPSDYELTLTSAATPIMVLGIQADGHVVSSGTVPTLTSCGSSPSVDGTDTAGVITIGGGVVTSCTLNFANAFGRSPVCLVQDNSTTVSASLGTITNTSAIFNTSATLGGGLLYYVCIGNRG